MSRAPRFVVPFLSRAGVAGANASCPVELDVPRARDTNPSAPLINPLPEDFSHADNKVFCGAAVLVFCCVFGFALAVDDFFFGRRGSERLSSLAHLVGSFSGVVVKEMRARDVAMRPHGVPSGRAVRVLVTFPVELR